MAAVLARLTPKTAVDDLDMLGDWNFRVSNEPAILRRATTLAIGTGQHLFDTLYHAIALEHDDAMLVTADDRYCAKASHMGKIVALRDWHIPTPTHR